MRKKKHYLGMTIIQIVTLVIIGCITLVISTVAVVLVGMNGIDFGELQKVVQRLVPTQALVQQHTSTVQESDCSKEQVNRWIDKATGRRRELDADFDQLNASHPDSYDDYKYYADRAKARYEAQYAQFTPSCLANAQQVLLEEFRVFWKGLDAANRGDGKATADYMHQLVVISEEVDRAFQASGIVVK